MKKFLILQMRPKDETADSEFEAIMRVAELDRENVYRVRVERLKNLEVDLNNYCAIIAGGSPFDISYPANKKSDEQRQVESFFKGLFDQVIPIDFPFLGMCSGSGLLGNYCGTVISGKYPEPPGTVMLTVTKEGENDALLAGLPNSFPGFVGHKEACDDVPQGAVLLVTSKPCPVQMYRIEQNVYATQFHPEADAAEFILRINNYKHSGYFPPEKAEELISTIQHIETPISNEILRRFAKKYRSI